MSESAILHGGMLVPPVPVAIVGAGPVGLALALGLARSGVRSLLVERRDGLSRRSKAAGIHVRTQEILRQWEVEPAFLDEGTLLRTLAVFEAGRDNPLFALDFAALDDEANNAGLLLLEQARTEALLLAAVAESGMCDVRFATDATHLEQDAHGVRLTLRSAGRDVTVDAAFAVGCDGASSFVRRALGLPFDGATYDVRPLLADVRFASGRGSRGPRRRQRGDPGGDGDSLPWPRLVNRPDGLTFALHLPGGLWRVVRLERGGNGTGDGGASPDVSPEEAARAVAAVLGEGEVHVEWASRFRIHIRAAPRFRIGRILLAGDAAHVHSPAGGFGMNAGIQDAHNLAWKLAGALRGEDRDPLLDSYDVERRAVVVGNVSRFTDRVMRGFVAAPAWSRTAVFRLLRLAVRFPGVRRRVLRRAGMIDLHYVASPLLSEHDRIAGARLPNVPLLGDGGRTVRLYDLLPYAPTEINVDVSPHGTTVGIGGARYADPTGRLRRMTACAGGRIVVRPDLHVARAELPDPTP